MDTISEPSAPSAPPASPTPTAESVQSTSSILRRPVISELDAKRPLLEDRESILRALEPTPDTLVLDCRRPTGGAWAGLVELVQHLVAAIDPVAPELLERHRYELASVLPPLRRRFPLTDHSLTDAEPVKERVRSYPVDRAYRLIHGMVDLLKTWWSPADGRAPGQPPRLVLWGFDQCSAMTERFVVELVRRAGNLPIALELIVAPGAGEATAARFSAEVEASHRVRGLAPCSSDLSEAALRAEAERVDAQLDDSMEEVEKLAPRLVAAWNALGQHGRGGRWRTVLLAIYNHYGWYEDALFFGAPLVPHIEAVTGVESMFTRWHIISGLFNCYVALGRAETAHELVRDEALAKVDDTTDLVSIYYSMAMLHVRFLPERDLERGERYLQQSLEVVEDADLSTSEKHYLRVFNLNGLAFIRHLQGDPPAAIELCEDGYDHLQEHLSDSEYRLHRSVLLYNIAQVYASMGQLDKALEQYTAAIEVDPNYSEYYNERASVYLRMGRLDTALADLERAIEISPPYPEVWINLGQTLKLMGRDQQAIAAYDRALDLDPSRTLPRLGRAQARERAGDLEGAMSDYAAALDAEPDQALVWANLAALRYEAEQLEPALDAIERAIALEPTLADLRSGRAAVLADLGRRDEAAAELARYLELAPDADDAAEIATRREALLQPAPA